ncbi:MAG: HAD-IIA family hydrolase [Chloroflexi bacterium]|nr:HAD-IIA family hydrolase [Chloroflexota bacterium]
MPQPALHPRSLVGLILDMDGVLWRGSQPLGDLPALFRRLEDLGLRWVFVTNNATRSPADYVEKLARFGVPAQEEDILNSALAAVAALRERWPQGDAVVHVLGEGALRDLIAQAGFSITAQPQADAVVVALDRSCTYAALERATYAIRGGAWFVGTNPDRTYPTPQGLAPGAGALLAALEAATDVAPTIVGKPEPWLFRLALQRLNARPEQVLMVGDRLETDILGAQRLGIPTALVLSGVTTREQADAWSPPPHLIAPDFTAVVDWLARKRRGGPHILPSGPRRPV